MVESKPSTPNQEREDNELKLRKVTNSLTHLRTFKPGIVDTINTQIVSTTPMAKSLKRRTKLSGLVKTSASTS